MRYRDKNNEWKDIKIKNYGIEQTPIGSMIYYPSQTIPKGYLVCDGTRYLISDYPELFKAIGYIGGEDVEEGYFKVPDMRGNVPAGHYKGLTESPLAGSFGDTVGDSTHTLTIDEMPSHKHELSLTDYGTDHCSAVKWETTATGGKFKYSYDMLQPTGGNQPHPIVQPTKLYHWLIKARNMVTLGGQTEDFEVTGHLSTNTLGVKHLLTISDCNDTNLENGIYYCIGNTQNTPHASAWFLEVKKKNFDDGSVDVITQTAYRYRDNEMWIRQYNSISSTGWKSWQVINQDSGWQTASLTSDFKPYNNKAENTPIYRKVGKMVEIKGIVAPNNTIIAGETANIFTLPEGYRPTKVAVTTICQGTGRKIWLLSVGTNGVVEFARYGSGEYADAATTVWLPFQTTFLID